MTEGECLLRDLVAAAPADILQAHSALHPLSLLRSSLIFGLFCQRAASRFAEQAAPFNLHADRLLGAVPRALLQEGKTDSCPAAQPLPSPFPSPATLQTQPCLLSTLHQPWPAAESSSPAASQEDGAYRASWHSPTEGCHWGSVYHLQAKH